MTGKCTAIYHRVMRRENFEEAAKDIYRLLVNAQQDRPNMPRVLYLDIDGHRNVEGGFDNDMFELQKDFVLGFLLPYFTEVHLPLCSIKNKDRQINDIPEQLKILNEKNERDDSLDQLYIENYSNTEFMSEEDVYAYLQKLSRFLKAYDEKTIPYIKGEDEEFDTENLLQMWHSYLKNIMIELFNNFIYGNLLSASAMTRTLIESYAYVAAMKKAQSTQVIEDWFLCSLIKNAAESRKNGDTEMMELVKKYCEHRKSNYKEEYQRFKDGNENEWLSSIIEKAKTGNGKRERIYFGDICKYLDEKDIQKDFKSACAFIHGQDITSKILPFTFYSSIYAKLYIMVTYMFKVIRLFAGSVEMEKEMCELEDGLYLLAENYLGMDKE